MTTKAEKAADLAIATETLTKYLVKPVRKEGSRYCENRQTVYCIVGHVAKSGMSRDIRFYVVTEGELVSLTWAIATIIDAKMHDAGLRIGGCGMDMRFAVLDAMARKMWGAGHSGNDFRIEDL
jgi:hypothetical protein